MVAHNLGGRTSEIGLVGATAGTPISAPALKIGDTVLAVVKYDRSSRPTGTDPAAWTVGAGTLTSATLNTANYFLAVLYSPA